eukprot:4349466-Lingulodinium_polyedra.AAC.1
MLPSAIGPEWNVVHPQAGDEPRNLPMGPLNDAVEGQPRSVVAKLVTSGHAPGWPQGHRVSPSQPLQVPGPQVLRDRERQQLHRVSPALALLQQPNQADVVIAGLHVQVGSSCQVAHGHPGLIQHGPPEHSLQR